PEAAPAVEAPIAATPKKKAKLVYVTGLGFKQMKETNKSRVTIGLSHSDAEYTSREEGPGNLVVEISNARFKKKILKREFNTREFKTAILRVIPKENAKSRTVQFSIDLEQQMPYTVNQEGNNIYVDVDIPAQLLRKTTPAVAAKTSGGES